MSELTKTDEIKDEPVVKPELDIKSLMERMNKLEATNSRLLEESKSYKSKYSGLRTEVEEKEKIKLTENEQWQELLEIEKNKRSESDSLLKETKKTVLQKELNFKVASFAGDAHNINSVISALPKSLISIDEENLVINGVEEAVNSLRASDSWMFNTEKKSGMPSGRPVTDVSVADEKIDDNELFGKAFSEGIL